TGASGSPQPCNVTPSGAQETAAGRDTPKHGELLLSSVITALSSLGKTQLPGQLARWLDQLDETGRWALLKLVTGGLRIGVSARLYSRTGEDISGSFPDIIDALRLPGAIDGELLIMRQGRVQSFNVLQQRLNRKTVSPALLTEFPAHLRAYDLLVDGEEDLRERPFVERRARLERFIARLHEPRVDLSLLVAVAAWDDLIVARQNPAAAGADADAIEGIMVKRRDAPYVPGRS